MLIFIDLETTGLESSDKICSIALLNEKNYIYELINEGKKIPAEASSIHHITNEDIQGKGTFKESEVFKYLTEYNSFDTILISHNVSFVLEMFVHHGFVWQGRSIDTLRCTKHLLGECEQFSLQFLRYDLKLYREEKKILTKYEVKEGLFAHHALSDAIIVKILYEALSEMKSSETLQELSQQNVLISKLSFGKHKGRYIEEVLFSDFGYIEWLLSSEIDEDMRYSLNYYIQKG